MLQRSGIDTRLRAADHASYVVKADHGKHKDMVGIRATCLFAVVVGEVGGNLVGQVAVVAQAGQGIGLAGMLKLDIGHMQLTGTFIDLLFKLVALAQVDVVLPPVTGVQHRSQQQQS